MPPVRMIRALVTATWVVALVGRAVGAQPPRPQPVALRVRGAFAPPDPTRLRPTTTAAAHAEGRHHEIAGALIGALAGGVTTVILVSQCEREKTSSDGPPCALGYVYLPTMVLVGAIAGGIVGRFIPARDPDA